MSTKTHRVCSNPESLRDLNSWKEDGPVDVHYYVSGVREFRAHDLFEKQGSRFAPRRHAFRNFYQNDERHSCSSLVDGQRRSSE